MDTKVTHRIKSHQPTGKESEDSVGNSPMENGQGVLLGEGQDWSNLTALVMQNIVEASRKHTVHY